MLDADQQKFFSLTSSSNDYGEDDEKTVEIYKIDEENSKLIKDEEAEEDSCNELIE